MKTEATPSECEPDGLWRWSHSESTVGLVMRLEAKREVFRQGRLDSSVGLA